MNAKIYTVAAMITLGGVRHRRRHGALATETITIAVLAYGIDHP